jgi:alkylated DNA repair protein (DNA oxidative demethylase)
MSTITNLAAETIVGRLSQDEQVEWARLARDVARVSGMLRPKAGGREMSVRISNAGAWGWVADERGYRYASVNPQTGRPWAEIPAPWLEYATSVAGAHPWDCAHLVWYERDACLGWHRDVTERRRLPIVTVSLGDQARWSVREDEGAPICTATLESGHTTVLSGPTREALHRVDRIAPAGLFSPSPLGRPGRLAVSVRVSQRSRAP